MKEYPAHPFASLFPLKAGSSLIELSDSIAAVGQLEDIVLLNKQVLDGRRRQAAAIRAGKTPRYREFGSRPGDGLDPLEFSFHVNFDRRDMSEAERAMAAVGYATFKRGANQHSKEDTTKVGSSQQDAADKFGVNVKQVERAKSVMTNGVEELKEAMQAERVSITDAASIANEPPDVQRQAVEDVLEGRCRTLREAVSGPQPAAPEDAGKIGRELAGLIDRLRRVSTANVAARDLACAGLEGAAALIGKL